MTYVVLLVLGFLISLGVQWKFRIALLSLMLPSALFIFFVMFQESRPYSGGGASMWPIAILFGVPILLVASTTGLIVAKAFFDRNEHA